MRVSAELFRRIFESVPLVCVDLVIRNANGEVLLVRRNNEPAAGQWWFPGGRVFIGETRLQAASRKLLEETGLVAGPPREMQTEDVIFEAPVDAPRHGVTTVFLYSVAAGDPVRLDAQSTDALWRQPTDWLLHEGLHPFVGRTLRLISALPDGH